ncbi:hypothetical protein QQX98_012220 [Neonectria punicea]|uniref:AB hydrolase-1 domain-containing protein n=1 Tax=Neonectria punicea TaxID=979145 RepID=A0ABR1GJG9_9HYPO
MQAISTESALIKGSRIAYGVHGTGEPVVLIHGTPSSSLIWRNVVPKLVAADFKVYVFDLLGYGLSERPWDPSVDTSMTGQVPILEDLLALWGLDSTHIVAHDIGGGIAQRLSVFSPQRVRSLTLIDVVSFDSYPLKRTKQQMQNGLEALIKADDNAHKEHFREWLLTAVKNPQKLADTHELQKLPVQVIWGADDGWQVVDWAHKLQSAIPGSELHLVEDAGHFSPEDQPEKISELVVSFLGKQ